MKRVFDSGRPAMRRAAVVFVAVLSLAAAMSGSAMATVVASSGKAIATASVDGSSPAIRAFGGSKTKSASVSGSDGDYEVTFTGNYPKSISVSSLIVNSTAESIDFAVSNAVVVSASTTTIVVNVFTFDPSTESDFANNFFVTVFFGDAP